MSMLTVPLSAPGRAAASALLAGVGTAVPRGIAQSCIAELVRCICCQSDAERQWAGMIFERCGVGQRGSVLLEDPAMDGLSSDQALQRIMETFYPPRRTPADRGPGTARRLAEYAKRAPAMALAAAADALRDAGIAPGDITHLLPVSCTGFFAPGLDAALIGGLALPPSVKRVQVGFMGCHAAFNALAAASAIVRAEPASRVLLCCVELCTLHLAYGWDPQKVVANALFADGAGAAVLQGAGGAAPPGAAPAWTIDDTASLLVPGSGDAMTWTVGDHGFEMTLSPALPELIRGCLRPWLTGWLKQRGLELDDVRSWAVHPGGPKVLSAVTGALDLPAHAVQVSREVLRQHGNMSSATILFILDQLRRSSAPTPCVALGFGPGLMCEAMLVS